MNSSSGGRLGGLQNSLGSDYGSQQQQSYLQDYTGISTTTFANQGLRPLTPEETALKNFTQQQLETGQFEELERIETPQPGAQFDMNLLAVSAVLTLNKAIEVIAALEKRIEVLELNPPSVPESEFTLAKLSDGYDK